jgi:hypothetical protein
MDDQLLAELKSNLRITWSDEDEDLKKLLVRAGAYLNELCGDTLDYSEDGQPKTLLLERCRYVYNNAADEFEPNFKHELSRLILKVAMSKVVVSEPTV